MDDEWRVEKVKTIKPVQIEEASSLLKLLGDKTRLTIISLLLKDELCVCELVEILKMSQPGISQHIKKLKAMDLVKERRQGQWIFYRLNTEAELYPLLESVAAHLPDQGDKLKDLENNGLRVCCK
ncbi:ArsR/SmtB family transcription factor [Evansella clarkii]|uniref:ArsR/SmtB family transcription factor n=1 Tax=Evansella clarkii TaxID=79879 RepID=UPI0009988606|nr:metalloregulator ArsR/SmtB family transcription factor [Evansella clarkii]